MGAILLILLFLLYFLPAIIAVERQHPQYVPIILLNVFLGWTFLGWLAALIWATTNSRPMHIIIQNNLNNLVMSPAPIAVTQSNGEHKIRKLLEAKELRKSGLLSHEEYEQKRGQIIGF